MCKLWRKGLLLMLLMGSNRALAYCWEEVATRYDLEPELLQAIAAVESGYRAQAMNHTNRNGTRDIGLMQINSIHLPRLLKQGITEERLLNEPCLSVEVGASILAEFIQRFGYNWTAVGSYNVGPGAGPQREALRLRYAEKIWVRYEALVSQRQ
ncbi:MULTISPECIES: transglycosylase SLT domain-containing protein [Pseudomonas]|uniref:Invasion protein IagB n=1 Tax=Pseudomonas haemolytica TaxID=2600065 RepID=A0A5P1DIH5_9PSED|nr:MULTISPECIES: transglycosylase SLT domain-containing protein [Pseudomonas]MBJ2247119.1 transglycosylase SLT domain-containing protein [Pseudomonas haemolytica]MBJ2272978.1 transglycosylase SLT domain-containing protein [Pseudomonas haemolytica]MBJ2283156.1 transglycosylase SLT domain-containing protein [Pseudomonas sp. MF6755]MBK3447290.1 transglycosylase SLT domain-containing protein [Pseudomonas haemolytica]MBK3458785.1 transglycosylase SLT domain-containing protein [Pseudomonas haemolyti